MFQITEDSFFPRVLRPQDRFLFRKNGLCFGKGVGLCTLPSWLVMDKMHCERGAQALGGPTPCLGSAVLLRVQCVPTVTVAAASLPSADCYTVGC